MSCLRWMLLVVWALHLSGVSAIAALPLAWTALGPDGQVIVRVVSTTPACPVVQVNAERFPLRVRAQPSRPDFPILVCEAALPPDATSVTLAGRQLAAFIALPGKNRHLGRHRLSDEKLPGPGVSRSECLALCAYRPECRGLAA